MNKIRKIRVLILCLIVVVIISILKLQSYSIKSFKIHQIQTVLNFYEKVDWNDYQFIEYERSRTGIGEQGQAAYVEANEREMEQMHYRLDGYNSYLGDKIALNRSIPDIRHTKCHNRKYLKNLPTVSVIIPFYNEHWSTLLRSAVSVVNRSPPSLLKEVILVDDGSMKPFLKEKLDKYIAENLPKVKILHYKIRSGLIFARLAGAKIATGEVLVIFDAHIEVNVNWLPPLLEPIAKNYKTCTLPLIDDINFRTFHYGPRDEGARGIFDWTLYYKRVKLRDQDIENMPEPFHTPVMQGGLFAISAKFFWELGGYDQGLDIWGGEQFEISFKIWQCGGEMFEVPCSRVGHVFRSLPVTNLTYENPDFRGKGTDILTRNFKRVAEVWMDEYKQYLYMRDPIRYNGTDPGDITEQVAIRKLNKCKSFKWFLEDIAPDLIKEYPLTDPPDFALGAIKSLEKPYLCIDTLGHNIDGQVGLFSCAENLLRPQLNQYWSLSWFRDIRIKFSETCWDVPKRGMAPVILMGCHSGQGNQLFRYYPEKHQIVHSSGLCITANFTNNLVFATACVDSDNQKWEFGYHNKTALDNWETSGKKLLYQ